MPYGRKKICTKSDIKSHKSDMFYFWAVICAVVILKESFKAVWSLESGVWSSILSSKKMQIFSPESNKSSTLHTPRSNCYPCVFFWYSLGVTPKYFLNCSVK